MDLDKIKDIINNSDITNEVKEMLVLDTLATDKRAIPYMLILLERERKQNKDLIQDLNSTLSLADVYIDTSPQPKRRKGITYKYVSRQIELCYAKWKKYIIHCCNKKNYPSPDITDEDIEKELN